MNSRERFLAILLIVAMTGTAGGVAGYQLVLKPLNENAREQAKLRGEIDELKVKQLVIENEQNIYETRTRKMSLPRDVTVAQRDYARLLDHMLRGAKFRSPQITPLPPESKTKVPMLAAKKPAYTKLNFMLTLEGDLLSLVDFLYAFYRQPLLHQVHAIDILKPTRSKGATADDRELTFKLNIQALVLDQAEDRSILLPTIPPVVCAAGGAAATAFAAMNVESEHGSPFTVAGVLAPERTSAQDEYRRIAGKNIFFDPLRSELTQKEIAEREKAEREKAEKDRLGLKNENGKEGDLASYLGVTRVSHTDGKSSVMIFDRFNKQNYEVEMGAHGEVKVTHYYYKRVDEDNEIVGDIRVKHTERPYLEFGSEEKGNLRRYTVRRILENELLLEPYHPGRDKLMTGAAPFVLGGVASVALPPNRLFLWRVGQMLFNEDKKRSMTVLTSWKEKDDALHRPLELINEGEGTITFTGDGDGPPEMKQPAKTPLTLPPYKKKKKN